MYLGVSWAPYLKIIHCLTLSTTQEVGNIIVITISEIRLSRLIGSTGGCRMEIWTGKSDTRGYVFNLCNAYCVRIKWDNQVKALQGGVHCRSSITQAKKAEPPFFSLSLSSFKIFSIILLFKKFKYLIVFKSKKINIVNPHALFTQLQQISTPRHSSFIYTSFYIISKEISSIILFIHKCFRVYL